MSKAPLLSLQSQWGCKILNGEKKVEVRSVFPPDYVGWVYMYVTKAKPYLYKSYNDNGGLEENHSLKEWVEYGLSNTLIDENNFHLLNGKVVGRFWCDKVEEISINYETTHNEMGYDVDEMFETPTLKEYELCEKSCLTEMQLYNYLKKKKGYAIHIGKVEIFDEPKELSEFAFKKECKKCTQKCLPYNEYILKPNCCFHTLKKAGQNYCYIEVEDE